jgi:hypothetical protein
VTLLRNNPDEYPQQYVQSASLMHFWDIGTLEWVPGTQPHGAVGVSVMVPDGSDVAEGATTDTESASGNGSVVAILKRLRTLLNGGLPAALATGGGLKATIQDTAGNAIGTSDAADGTKHLNVAAVQTVIADANNSSTTNLAAGNSYTFTGTKTSTLGVAGIQVSLLADKNCIIKVQQSPNATPNWDLSDTYYYTANSNFGVTVQAISSYVRVVVTTMSETTTTFRLQTALCPVVEAVPRSLDAQGNLKVSVQGDNFGNGPAAFTPNQELQTSPRYRLVGAQFEGGTLDPNFWLTSVSTGTVTISGSNVEIKSGTANGHYARLYSKRAARYVSGATNKFRAHMRLGDTGTANVKRRWGVAAASSAMPTITDGAYFELDGTTFSVVTLKTGNETRVSSGSFNGQLGYTYAPTTNNTVWEILLTNGSFTFAVGGVPLHKVTGSTTTLTDTVHFYVWMDVVNSGNSAAVSYFTRTAHIARLGQLVTQPVYYNFAVGQTAGVVLKYGPGNVRGIAINSVSNNAVVTLYDALASTGAVLWTSGSMGALTTPFDINLQDAAFTVGLTLVVATANAGCTVVYE